MAAIYPRPGDESSPPLANLPIRVAGRTGARLWEIGKSGVWKQFMWLILTKHLA